MNFMYFTFLFFAFGALITFWKKTSYLMATCASVLAFITSIVGLNAPFSSGIYKIFDGFELSIGIDHTSAIFLLIASISWFAITLYSIDYGVNYSKKMPIFLNTAFLGMFMVLIAKDAITFIIGWEIATIFSYLLIMEHKHSFKEAFEFLAFGEVSTITLLIAFASLYFKNHSFSLVGVHGTWIFLLMATIAFMTKMGIFPLHTWLIGAHSKAPSNVSAFLSAPLTLMGVYGLTRALSISGRPEWWGIMAMVFGGTSAFWGALQAVAAKGLKILPAYSTVENDGTILATLGLSITAFAFHINVLGEFAMLTTLILTFSHVITKTLLFLAVGHAKEALNEESIDNVRGVWKAVGKIPAFSIVISALSFSVFPPLIGYVAEWMTLETLFQSYKIPSMTARITAAFIGILLALAMGMAAFSMVKLAGYTALGYDHGKRAKKIPHFNMNLAEIILVFVIAVAGFLSPLVVRFFGYKEFLSGLLGVPKPYLILSSHPIFGVVSPTFLAVVLGVLGVFPLIFYLAKGKKVKRVDAWNGGEVLREVEYFSAPAYSFTLEYILRKVYATKEVKEKNKRYVRVKDVVQDMYTGILVGARATSLALSRTLMNGHVYSYILYILAVFVLIFFMVR
ncbi:proton-conducting transporter membrane subunit [Mesoaciditoga lauensis]|uniref:proton-conducting transporter transmembrane domain-containing protein n=1 Tax=Mesoaciditoga lauensis TaxID=1495039 RepID=UPI00068F3350|nr:proton-conducting transporter membrane subunit [Mesoaciditoga lauensis]